MRRRKNVFNAKENYSGIDMRAPVMKATAIRTIQHREEIIILTKDNGTSKLSTQSLMPWMIWTIYHPDFVLFARKVMLIYCFKRSLWYMGTLHSRNKRMK